MTTKDLARLMPRVGGVLAIAAAVAVMAGAVTVGAQQNGQQNGRQDDRDDDRRRDDDKNKDRKKPWPKVRVCHADRDGRAHLLEIRGEDEAVHSGHGDGRPGDRVRKHGRHHRWGRECEEVPESSPVAAPVPSDPTLSCSCWTGYKQSALLNVLSPTAVPAESYCIAGSSMVSLSPDLGVSTLVYAANFCILRVNGVDVGTNWALTAPEAETCIAEAVALVPSINWCPQ